MFTLAISRGWLNALLSTIPQLPKDAIKREVRKIHKLEKHIEKHK